MVRIELESFRLGIQRLQMNSGYQLSAIEEDHWLRHFVMRGP
jgi:hypothetical protein